MLMSAYDTRHVWQLQVQFQKEHMQFCFVRSIPHEWFGSRISIVSTHWNDHLVVKKIFLRTVIPRCLAGYFFESCPQLSSSGFELPDPRSSRNSHIWPIDTSKLSLVSTLILHSGPIYIIRCFRIGLGVKFGSTIWDLSISTYLWM